MLVELARILVKTGPYQELPDQPRPMLRRNLSPRTTFGQLLDNCGACQDRRQLSLWDTSRAINRQLSGILILSAIPNLFNDADIITDNMRPTPMECRATPPFGSRARVFDPLTDHQSNSPRAGSLEVPTPCVRVGPSEVRLVCKRLEPGGRGRVRLIGTTRGIVLQRKSETHSTDSRLNGRFV